MVHNTATLAGQAQKETWVNEALARIDALLHCAVDGERTDPPIDPADGEAWIVADAATGEWSGMDGAIASWQSENWLFATPRDGVRILDRAAGQMKLFHGGWKIPATPMEPSGGSTVDVEARAAIGELIAALRVAGVIQSV